MNINIYTTVFCPDDKMENIEHCQKSHETQCTTCDFPLTPPDAYLCKKIIDEFCAGTTPSKFEAGCAGCSLLTL